MSPAEILSTASKLKDEGTVAFKEKMFEEALSLYEEASELLALKDDDDYMTPEAKAVWIACKLNASQVYTAVGHNFMQCIVRSRNMNRIALHCIHSLSGEHSLKSTLTD